jgi:hypothetical protein
MERTGKCLCGAVTFTAKGLEPGLTACHCDMCRRWTGSFLIALGTADVAWNGEDKITTFASSGWAERAFCSVCGTSLFYRLTAPGPHQGNYYIGFGTLDDPSGFDVNVEYFIDKKPEAYTLAGDRKTLTEAEVFATFGGE